MMRCVRGPAPEVLARDGAQLGREYADRRRETPAHGFRWPQREGRSLLEIVREALAAMTRGHCSYCDSHPLHESGLPTVDHFRPKSRPEFYELVCAWTNLFLSCTACNHAKREQWDEALLRPDELDFGFERYFEYRFDSGRLEPASIASAEDRWRAARTIEILDLNRAGTCTSRKRIVQSMRSVDAIEDHDMWAYRYLIPLCAE